MKFLTIKITNFMSISYAELDLDSPGLTLVEGINNDAQISTSNGSGKTSLLNAIRWVLFHSLCRSVPKDEVVNDIIGQDCKVDINFLLNNHMYNIIRHRLDATYSNKLIILCDGINISGSTPRKSQSILNDILPFNEIIFTNIIYFPAGMHNSYMHTNDYDKKVLLESLLDVSSYEKCLAIAKDELSLIKNEISSLTRECEYKKDSSIKYQARYDELTRTNNKKEQQEEIDILMDNRYNVMKQVLCNQKRSIELNNQILSVQANYTKSLKVNNLINKLISLMDGYISNNTKKCCTGLEHKDGPHTHPERSPVSILHGHRKSGSTVLFLSTKNLSLWRNYRTKFSSESSNLENIMSSNARELLSIKSSVIRINEYMSSYDLISTNSKIDLESSVKDLEMSKEKLASSLVKETYLIYIKDAFINMRSNILMKAILDLNKFIKVYIDAIFSESVTVKVTPSKESSNGGVPRISISIAFDNCNSRDYYTFSEGERKRIDLSLHMALIDLSNKYSNFSCNLLLLDEATEAIDQSGTVAVIDIIKKKFYNKSVFMISHQPFISNEISNKLTVIKEHGLSTISN